MCVNMCVCAVWVCVGVCAVRVCARVGESVCVGVCVCMHI
jgi:hypothetical protein